MSILKNRSNKPSHSVLSKPWIFFVAIFAWSWGIWGIAVLLRTSVESALGVVLLFLGGFGPLVMGIAFTILTKTRAGQQDYWERIIGIKRISLKWWLTLLLFVPILNGLSALIDVLLGGTGAVWGETLLNARINPLGLFLSAAFATLVPFIEELGWRGYALDRLQAKRSAFTATIILGTVWALWHFPLFFILDSYQASLGVGTLDFWLFMIGTVLLNFAFTWLYNNTHRSILAVILLHGMINFTGELFDITERAVAVSILLWFLTAVGITAFWGPKTFTGRKKKANFAFKKSSS